MWDSLVRVSSYVKIRRKLHHMLDSSVGVSKQQRWKKNVFLSVTVWDPGTGGQDMGTRSSRSHFPHDEMDAELAGATTNSDGKWRTVGYRSRYVQEPRGCGHRHVQVELSARCPRTARRPPGNPPVDNSILLRVSSPIWRGGLPQEGRREVGSGLLKFVDSSSTTTCKGSWTSVYSPSQAVSSMAKKVAV